MKLGMFTMPLHPPKRSLADTLEEDRQAVILADQLGFSETWCGEHLSSIAEPIASPLAFFSSLVHQTKQIKFGTGVLNLPQVHPAMIAAQIAQFDHLSKGRYLLGVGPGGLGSDFELLKLSDRDIRNEMMLESIDTMQKIWSQDAPYSIPGKHWDVNITDFLYDDLGIGEMLKTFQKPHPPICLSIVTPKSPSATMAGVRGWQPISANFVQARYLRSHWDAYAMGVESIGEQPDSANWRIARSILVTNSDSEADEYLSNPDCGLHFYFHYFRRMYSERGRLEMLKPDVTMPDEEATEEVIARSMVTWGASTTVLDKLVDLHSQWGNFGTLLMVGHDWDDASMWQRSMSLLATEVLPRFRQHVEATSIVATS
jgi:alkanesulfonate monooxygenase SsuD/methylene tetrahydromethanopterin reductase-like flavin-dependent oxidoreductase (luciferase family)